MAPIISLFIVLTLSILITRIATVALSHTGLSRETARFQARSAYLGVGFTTGESEKVVSHPVRRKIILLVMLIGNAGIITAISSLILAFISPGRESTWSIKLLVIIAGITVLIFIAQSGWIDRHLSGLVDRMLNRYTRLDVKDYASLLRLAGEYRVSELSVEPGDWLAGKTLAELNVRDEGILVLGIERNNGEYLGAPQGKTEIHPGDLLLLYGRGSCLKSLDKRKSGFGGDQEHDEAVEEQKRVEKSEEGK
jgi:hypothetical protein